MSLGGRLNYVAQPSDQQVGNNAYQPLPQFTGNDPYSQIMAMMPAFRNPYANASSGNALGGFDPSIYARNYSSGGGDGGGGGGEGRLEEEVGPVGDVRTRLGRHDFEELGLIDPDPAAQADNAVKSIGRIHRAEAGEGVEHHADGEDEDVFVEDVDRVLLTAHPGFHHGEAGVHEDHQNRANQQKEIVGEECWSNCKLLSRVNGGFVGQAERS